ncbi:hypothetical protein QQF64_012136 [Cirrhinus molitorella]|uniref:G-protein coupled receptors family 3 profile domain-containing protein n=1 Tax=Cirrhinus molitorella TaxID=172907 RepID=A0ABR3LWY8_9TELE
MTSGDFTIGGIFPLHYRVELPPTDYIKRPLAAQCRGFDPRAFRWALTMTLAVEEINNRKDILPNHTLAYSIFDSCATPVTAQKAVLAVLNGQDVVQSFICSEASPLLGLIGESGSSQSIVVSRTLEPFRIPMISYFSTCSCLSDRKQFPTFFRVVPSDDYQVKAIAQLLKRFDWTWIGVVTEDHDYGRFALQGLKREIENTNICLAYHEMIPKDYTQEQVLKILKVMKESTAKVVVVFSGEGEFYPFLREFETQNITGIQWIASEAWVTASILAETYPFLDGTIGFAVRQGHIPGLQDYLKTVTLERYSSNPQVQELWEALYGCSPSTSSLNSHLPSCTGKETLRQEHSAYMNTSSPRVTYNVYKAVYAFAHSLHNLIRCIPGNGPFKNFSCANLNNVFPWQLQHYLQEISFSVSGEEVNFDVKGDSIPSYDLINWQRHGSGDIQFVKVGLYDGAQQTGRELVIEEQAIMWFNQQNKASNGCTPGFRKAVRRGQPLCCFDCVPCDIGKISNQTDYWSNVNGTMCVPKIVEFLSHDAMGITLTVIAVVGAFLTVTVLVIFIYNKGTPIVRVNNSELSFFILLSLTLCFLCALVFIGEPTSWSCMLRHTAFSITFSLCISCILGKTLVVLAAFTATRPGNNIMKWLGPTQQRIIIFCCTLVQVVICTAWLTISPPFPYRNTKYQQSKIILDCNVGSDLAFWCLDRKMIYMFVSLFHLSSAVVNLNCSPQDDFDLPVFMTSGDFTIGGIFPLHYRVELSPTDYIKRPLAAQCKGFDPRAFRWALSMKLAVEEINNRKDLLSNHTLAYRIFDSCSTPVTAQKAVLAVLNGQDVGQSSMCSGTGSLLGLIGESGSSQSIVLSRTVQPFQIPMISYFSTCSCLSNRKQFPTFFRVLPNDDYQVKAVAQLLKRFGWTWIGVVTEDHDYGRFALQGLKREIENTNICLAYHEMIPKDYTQERVLKILKIMKESTAKVVVVFSVEGEFYPFLKEFETQNITGIQWIASEAWVTASMLAETYPFLDGTIGFAIRQGHIPGLQDYLKIVTPERFPSNLQVQELWEALYGCLPSTSSLNSHLPSCTGKETLRQEHSAYMNTSSPRVAYNVYKAVYAFAHSLHNLIHCKPGHGPFKNFSCANINNVFPWQLQKYLQDVSFLIAGENVKFDNNGDSVPYYDLINWQRHTSGDIQFVKVGLYDGAQHSGRELVIEEQAIMWSNQQKKASNSCAPGFRTAARRGQPLCCFDCVPCESGKISNQTDSVECMACSEDYWSNADGTECIPKVVEFLSHDAMGLTLSVIAVVGACLTLSVFAVFLYYRNTPVVRINNSELSFFILLSLTLCFLCALVFIGEPTSWSCMLRHTAFSITFSLCISCILGKTLVVLAAFTATRPGNNIMKWLGPTQQRIIIFCCTLVQVVICTAWLVASPPFPFRNTKYQQSKIILDCSVGSDLAFWLCPAVRGVNLGTCILQGNPQAPALFKSGDLIIGGVFSIHDYLRTEKHTYTRQPQPLECSGSVGFREMRFVRAFEFAIEEINNSSDLLPGITLGYHIYDSCASVPMAIKVAFQLANGLDLIFNDTDYCAKSAAVTAVVAESGSTPSISISRLLGSFGIPQVSHYATCACLSDKRQYPTFFRTIPSDHHQAAALARMVKHFGWTWIGAVRSDSDYGNNGMASFLKAAEEEGICVEYSEAYYRTQPRSKLKRVAEVIRRSMARVIVAFLASGDMRILLEELSQNPPPPMQWIGSEAWVTDPEMLRFNLCIGAVGFGIPRSIIPGFRNFLLDLSPQQALKFPLLTDFYESLFSCSLNPQTGSATGMPACDGTEDLRALQNPYTDTSQLRITNMVYKATYAIAHAVDAIVCNKKHCDKNVKVEPLQVFDKLKQVNFTKNNYPVSFDTNGDPVATYELVNWQLQGDGSIDFVTVGFYDASQPKGQEFSLSRAIIWNNDKETVPVSVCSESCPPGTRKAAQKGKPVCCYDCINCAEGEISNETGTCILQDDPQLPALIEDGDFVIGGSFTIHYNLRTEKHTYTRRPQPLVCSGSMNFRELRFARALQFAIQEINNSSDLLPGITLGYHIYDSCASLLMVSHYATCACLSDKQQHPTFFRTIPSDYHQAAALARMVKRFGWTWIGAVRSDTDYGNTGMTSFLKAAEEDGICVEYSEAYYRTQPHSKLKRVADVIRRSTARVIVAFMAHIDMRLLLQELSKQPPPPMQWIGSEAWVTDPQMLQFNLCIGAVGFAIPRSVIPGFRNFLLDLSPEQALKFSLLTEFWQSSFSCSLKRQTDSSTSMPACNGTEDLRTLQNPYTETSQLRITNMVYKATYAIAHALHGIICNEKHCDRNIKVEPWQVPVSVCSESCSPGTRKAVKNGRPVCCYDCINCADGEISNETGTCILQDDPQIPALFEDGDFVIGGSFTIHYNLRTEKHTYTRRPQPLVCSGSMNFRELRFARALQFAIQEINNSSDLLPGITLGYHIYDSCASLLMVMKIAVQLTNGLDPVFNDTDYCVKSAAVLALVGESGSSAATSNSRLFGRFGIPQVSHYATCACLSDKQQHPTFFRTIPSDHHQAAALARMVKRFGWTWIGAVRSDTDYGNTGMTSFLKAAEEDGICVEYSEAYYRTQPHGKLKMIADVIRRSTARVIVAFMANIDMRLLLQELSKQPPPPMQWIGSEAWVTDPQMLQFNLCIGAVGFAIPRSVIPGFRNFLLDLSPEQALKFSVLTEFWERSFSCSLKRQTDSSTSMPACNGTEDLRALQNPYTETSQLRITNMVYKATYAIAHALHGIICNENHCDRNIKVEPWQVYNQLKRVNFTKNNYSVSFDTNGEPVAKYELVNWQLQKDGSVDFVTVGQYDASKPKDQEFSLSRSIIWYDGNEKVPVSVCSESCSPGTRKAVKNGRPVCCYDCINCADGEISNETDSLDCHKCLPEYWSNNEKDKCLPKPVEFLSWVEILGIILAAFSIAGSLAALSITLVFYKNRTSPIETRAQRLPVHSR